MTLSALKEIRQRMETVNFDEKLGSTVSVNMSPRKLVTATIVMIGENSNGDPTRCQVR